MTMNVRFTVWLSSIPTRGNMFRQPFKGDYPITLDYGEAFPPLYTHESPHRGIDYGCPTGTPILASDDGTVTLVKDLPTGYGKYIMIQHDGGYQTIYAHLSSLGVRVGQDVTKGDVIAMSGNTGNSTGPHLHFEVRKQGIQIDPKGVLQSVLDADPISSTPTTEKPQFEPVQHGKCMVVCDVANARCHCDMNRITNQLKKGTVIYIGDTVTMYHGLPYRDYFDPWVNCWLRIAEHDPEVQMLRNVEE